MTQSPPRLHAHDFRHMVDVIASILVDDKEWSADTLDTIYSVLHGRVLEHGADGFAEHKPYVTDVSIGGDA